MGQFAMKMSGVLMTVVFLAIPTAWSAEAPANAGELAKVDITKPGTYSSGQWEYRLVITAPGTKSEGSVGSLLFGGKPVEEAVKGDYYRTPWGEVQWVGNPAVPWGKHGWFLRAPGSAGGRELPDPRNQSGPVVMAMILTEGSQDGSVPPWVKEEANRLGVKQLAVQKPWFALNDQAYTVEDSKMRGQLYVRLLPAREAETLTVLFDGSKSGRLELPRKDGETRLVLRTLKSSIDSVNFYLAFRVEHAAPAWPRPLDIGPESDGKEVVVKGVKEVVISLPGDKRSGCVWSIKRVQGDAIGSSSVKASGEPQFTPAEQGGTERKGVFENVLRVVGTGKSDVELEYKPAWQKDKPGEKTYKVTLDVRELPAAATAPASGK